MARPLEDAHARPAADVAEELDVTPEKGLSAREAERRLEEHGENKLRRTERKSIVEILVHQFQSVIVWLLAAAAVLSFALGDLAEGLAIVAVLVINGSIGFVTELRAARSMEALLDIAEVRTRVRRDGKERRIDAREIVPGDIVVLEAGDVVTADLRLVACSNLQSDESVLTGESAPVAKSGDAAEAEAGVGDRPGMVFKGTAITQGGGAGVVVATGMETEIGRISDLAQSAKGEAAPLERRLDRLGHRLVFLTLALAVVVIGIGLLRGYEMAAIVQTGMALAVAAVPEGLPVVATLSLARGMLRMSRRNALIRRLSAVETLGATTVILTDKTGTLTENRMTAVRYLLADEDVEVECNGETAFMSDDSDVSPETDDRLAWALRVGALCNTASLGDGAEDDAGQSGDPMEIALLSVAEASGEGREALIERHETRAEHAFDPDLKMMATVHAAKEGVIFAVKGAPEEVVAACTQELGPDGPRPLDEAGREDWMSRNGAAARDGLRLLALAMKRGAGEDEEPYEDLVLVGLVCLLDPLREAVTEAIAASRAAGVRVVMLTGDHADTAETIARDAGLGDGELTVIPGSDLADFSAEEADEETRERLLRADVFARVAPDTKLDLVTLYQDAGHVVAMTGDGVNDAPALKKADIGVAMGQRGTDVAREASDMVLKDDAFGTIIDAMRQGRVIFGNIRRFVVYLMSCNVSEVLVVGLAIAVGMPVPLLPLQILYLNLVTDVFPAFALGLGKGDEEVMHQPPRDPDTSIVDRPRWVLIAALGAAITVATLAAFALALYWLRLSTEQGVTVAFVTLALAQLWNVFNLRSPASGFFGNVVTRNPYVWGAIALCLGLVAVALWMPGLSDLLGLPAPGPAGLGLALGMSVVPLALGQLLLTLASPDWLDPHEWEVPGSAAAARPDRSDR